MKTRFNFFHTNLYSYLIDKNFQEDQEAGAASRMKRKTTTMQTQAVMTSA